MLKELVRTMAVHLVDSPEHVIVTEISGENSTLIELKVARQDIGKVIGKDGRTAQSMRAILLAVAQKEGKRVQLDIVD